jgi:hypothetical protein
MIQVHAPHCFRQAIGFSWIKRFRLFLKVNIAVRASSRAGGSHNQKRGSAVVEALANVGTGCLFTHGIQTEIPQNFLDSTNPLPLRGFDS